MMKFSSLFVLLLCAAACCTAQRPVERHIIICINFVDVNGKSLSWDGDDALEAVTIPELRGHSGHADDFSETLLQDDNDSSFYFDVYQGKPSRIGSPFSGRHYIMSGPLREFVFTRPGKDDNDAMRIILLNYNHPATAGGRVPVYFMENIVFRRGSYEVNCRRFTSSKKAVYNNRMPLQLFRMNRQPRKKSLPVIPRSAFSNYRISGFSFYNDSLFKYHNAYNGFPQGGGSGNGGYRLTPGDITLLFTEPEGKKSVQKAMPQDSAAGVPNSIMVRVTDERDGTPVPGATVRYKGIRQGGITNAEGAFYLTVQPDAVRRILQISAMGYEGKEILLAGSGHYQVNCQLRRKYVSYIDSGTIQKGVFTDFTRDFIGIYWLSPGETFSLNNQEQMGRRIFYEHKRFRPLPLVIAD